MDKKFIQNPTDAIKEQAFAWFGHFPKNKMALTEYDFNTLLDGAHNVIFVEGTASGKSRMKEAFEAAIHKAEITENHFDFKRGKKYLIQVTADEMTPIQMEEIKNFENKTTTLITNDAELKCVVVNQKTKGAVNIKIAATDLPVKQ